jgi:hypothetical protein
MGFVSCVSYQQCRIITRQHREKYRRVPQDYYTIHDAVFSFLYATNSWRYRRHLVTGEEEGKEDHADGRESFRPWERAENCSVQSYGL